MKDSIRLVIVTGMSGAGKTQAIKHFEDLGFFCVDNLPPAFILKMAEMFVQSEGKIHKLALGIDIRGGQFFGQVMAALAELEREGIPFSILFLEARDEVLVRRYKESRHRHPLAAEQGRTLEAIYQERRMLEELRGRATHLLDTSNMSLNQFRQELTRLFVGSATEQANTLLINVVSFGFKHGLPLDADLVFDVRFLPNPHYVPSLKERTGHDPAVQEYVCRWSVTQRFFRRLAAFVGFLIPHYAAEGKTELTVAIGCTGGQHRSVALALRLTEWLRGRGYTVRDTHRDARREPAEERG